MDELRLKLTTKLMRNLVSKLLAKAIQRKTGCKVKIQLDDLDIWMINGDTTIKVNVEAKMKNDEFERIVKSLNID